MRRQLVLLIVGLVGILLVARVLDSYAVATGTDAPALLTPSVASQSANPTSLVSDAATNTAPLVIETSIAATDSITADLPVTTTPTATLASEPISPTVNAQVTAEANDDMSPPMRVARGTPAPSAAAFRPITPALATSTPTPKPTLPPVYTVNHLPMETFIVMPGPVKQRVREIYAKGQALGRNPRAFSKMGDSTILWPRFLAVFDTKKFDLGGYAYLEPSVGFFAGSFSRDGVATRKAFHSWSAFDPMWADKSVCQPNEAPLPCEFRLNNPSVIIIRLGVNDSGSVKMFDEDLRKIITYCVESGVIPVIGTKPDRFEGPDNAINDRMRKIAAEFNVPLWDYDLVAGTVPGRGLDKDNVHMYPASTFDYTLPQTFESGDAMHSLTALMMLDALRTEVLQPDNPKPRHSD
jgi:hypothetical protein